MKVDCECELLTIMECNRRTKIRAMDSLFPQKRKAKKPQLIKHYGQLSHMQ